MYYHCRIIVGRWTRHDSQLWKTVSTVLEKTAGEHRSASGTKITMSIKPHLREIQGEKKWSDARGVFLEVARREGNTKSVRKAIVRSSAWNPSRGEKKKTARENESSSIEHFWRVLPYRGLINRCHYRAWIHFARPDLFAKMTRNRWRRPIDTTRRGTGRQRDSRNGGTIRREKIRSTIDR